MLIVLLAGFLKFSFSGTTIYIKDQSGKMIEIGKIKDDIEFSFSDSDIYVENPGGGNDISL